MLSFALQVIATFLVSLIAFSALFLVAKHRGYISFVASKSSLPIVVGSIQPPTFHLPVVMISSATDKSEHFVIFDSNGHHFDADIYSNSINAVLGSFESEAGDYNYTKLDAAPSQVTRLLRKIHPTVLANSNERTRAHSPNTLFALA